MSSESGFNRTYFENWYDDGSLMSKGTTEFVKFQDTFLPKKWTISQYFKDGGLMRQEDCTIENKQINMPIPDSTFSIHTHLNNGDKLIDKIAGKEYKYQDANLVLIAEPNNLPEPNSPPK